MRMEELCHFSQSPLNLRIDLIWPQPHESCREVGEQGLEPKPVVLQQWF
jgi:hypothetical protein